MEEERENAAGEQAEKITQTAETPTEKQRKAEEKARRKNEKKAAKAARKLEKEQAPENRPKKPHAPLICGKRRCLSFGWVALKRSIKPFCGNILTG